MPFQEPGLPFGAKFPGVSGRVYPMFGETTVETQGVESPMRAWNRLHRVFSHVMPGHFHRAERHAANFRKVIR